VLEESGQIKEGEEGGAEKELTLLSKAWDKEFDQNEFFIEETTLDPGLMSEKQEAEMKREREAKCGQMLW
jgi:hypothetical protein